MKNEILQNADEFTKAHRRAKQWQRVVTCLAAVVVFCTTYVLILPAITLEKTPQCPVEEHIHSESCYTQVKSPSRTVPVCTAESLNLHRHTTDCRDESGEYGCGYSDFVVHRHDAACYDEDGSLWCPLPEIKPHTHSESCYARAETQAVHAHTDECYTMERGELICAIPEAESAHTHSVEAGCFEETDKWICQLEESDGHRHGEGCWDENGELTCDREESEGHRHSPDCYETALFLTCQLSDEPHQHADGCYKWNKVLTCELSTEPEAEPAERQLICGEEEIILHKHTQESCFETDGNGNPYLICDKIQVLEHVHTEACFQTSEEPGDMEALSCNLEEHTHSAACGVIGLIGALPTQQAVEEHMASFETEDENGSAAYLTELRAQLQKAFEAYNALPEEEQAKVTNAGRLSELEWLMDVSTQETVTVSVTNEEGGSASVTQWTGDTSAARNHLEAALLSVGQGYTIQSIEYYGIRDLTGSKASVTYSSGGLDAANGAQVFVYDLGEDGMAAPRRCTVEDPFKDEETGLFTSFRFEIPAESEGASHIYAFISAIPATLEDMGIYPGEKQADGTWVACNGATQEDASIKAIITLPEDVTAPEGYRPFIRRINEGEGYYPDGKAIAKAAGNVNDWQCYTIRWIMQDPDGSLHMIPLNHGGMTATVEIQYLKEDARLFGPAGGRKLLIYNSNKDGSLADRVADTVENVQVVGDSYDKFTFHAALAGPYVFVSKNVEKGYIEALRIESIIDGAEPFDNSDDPGYDSGPSNKTVRSYDTIQYNLTANFAARQESVVEKSVNMYFELTLRKSATAARFNTSQMLWLGQNYSIEYLDEGGNVIMVMAHDGKYYLPKTDGSGNVDRDEHGFASPDTGKPVSMNAQVNGSTAGENSYKVASGGVAVQRLVGWTTLTAKGDDSILSGTQSFPMAIGVRNADNGEIIAPAFRMWLEGNEENYGEEKATEGGWLEPAQPDRDNIVDVSDPRNAQYQVTVSAGTNFNVQLKKNSDMSYRNWFDFSTGRAVAEPDRTELERLANLPENHGKSDPAKFTEDGAPLSAEIQAKYASYRYGRITCYGIALQLYNHADNKDDRDAKGFKGLSLPVGNITFDLNFSSTVTANGETLPSDEYTAILWDYNENIPADRSYTDKSYVDPGRGTLITPGDGLGNGKRTIYWDGESRSPYAKGAAPSNYKIYHDGCYYGGDWALVDENGQKADTLDKIYQIASPKAVTGSGSDATYHFRVSDYDFDFDTQHFPTRDAGNSGDIEGYDTYARCFSAGCVQVLSVFPRVQKVSEAEIFLNTTVSNLHLTTRAGQTLTAQPGDTTKIRHEKNPYDNTLSDQIVLYAPGGLTKGNSFNGKYKDRSPNTTTEGFLGTEYWTTSFDCSAFAGDDIWIVSYGFLSSGGDYRMRSMNLLQLFDSRALSIRDTPDVRQNWDEQYDEPGTATFLYAADPDYPNGYDTNHKSSDGKYDVLAYMNTVREEDLRYFTSLDALKNAGYTCVGVLMELRNCDLLGGKYQYFRIPVKVNGDDEDLVGNTVATVNTFRVWSWNLVDENGQAFTWANGKWDGAKNVLEGFPKPTNTYDSEGYSGEIVNQSTGSPPNYVKTEYQDNLQVKGTHAGGTLSGNSLLILNYKAGINIGVDNKESTGMNSYNLGDGESVVDYRLKNIRTDVSDRTSQTDNPVTDLTINTVLDEGYTGEKQRISVSGGSYRIEGYAVDADGNAASEETSIAIGSDPEHPTELEFVGSDGNRHRIRVYAQLGANSQSVRFVIKDAPVGLYLPDITFQANFAAVTSLNNNDTIKTATYISGTSDKRAYDQTKGNTDNITVGIVLRSGTNLTKAVSTRYIELDGVITYYVTYTNSGTDTLPKIYFYDLLPNTNDIRDSKFSGKIVLREIEVTSSREDGAAPANATVYYSDVEYQTLYDMVKIFGKGEKPEDRVADVEAMLANEKLFMPLAHVEDGQFRYDSAFDGMTPEQKITLMSGITGLYAKVEGLHKGQTVTLKITLQTNGNKADDWYKNIANSWIAGSGTLPLVSNKVETQVVSRTVSGVVWHDLNLDGIRDADEPRLKGVTATLFKKTENGYSLCTEDVRGKPIAPVTTGSDGAYAFQDLPWGDYIVAFSGSALEKFTDATAYQRNGRNDGSTNDGKAVPTGKGRAFDASAYAYYIRFSKDNAQMHLHAISEMGTVTLNKGVEMYANQDLGLIVATYELPQTGGTGNVPYIMGGLLLMAASAMFLWHSKKKRGKEDIASS